MASIPDAVGSLERDLRDIFGQRLQSLVVYGLRATGSAEAPDRSSHATHAEPPLATTLAVVDAISHADLTACAARVAAWHDAGLATPLILAAHEFANSLDAFPFEFGAILADHTVVAGSNPFDGLGVDPADLRRACEVQARSHLLHLREGYLETRGRADALSALVLRSAPAFAALLQSVARLQGLAAADARAAARHAERTLNITAPIVTNVVKLAGLSEISSQEAVKMFPGYLDAVERLVSYVDRWGAE